MFPIGESLAIRNLERAVFAGRERPAGTAVPTLRSGVRRLRIRIRCGVRPLRVAVLEPAVSAANGNRPPGTAVPMFRLKAEERRRRKDVW